jgi:hypothetical protein
VTVLDNGCGGFPLLALRAGVLMPSGDARCQNATLGTTPSIGALRMSRL